LPTKNSRDEIEMPAFVKSAGIFCALAQWNWVKHDFERAWSAFQLGMAVVQKHFFALLLGLEGG
jgi:hypothetical protein